MSPHGTTSRYNNSGCRCDLCRAAKARYQLEYIHRTGRSRPRAQYLAERYPEPPPHGTEGRYVRHGCRCDLCRAAGTQAKRIRRARAKLEGRVIS